MKLAISLSVALAIAMPARAEWNSPSRTESILFVASEALITVDCLQTQHLLNHPGSSDVYETNVLLGRHPSTELLFGVCAATMLGVAAGWWFLPTPWRDAVTLSVIFVEVPNVTAHAFFGARFLF